MNTQTDPETDSPPPGDAEIRATAWALDQMDPAERAAFEKEMAADPALAAYAREMRSFCATVSAELEAGTDASQLTLQDRRAPVVAALSQSPAGKAVVRGNFVRRHLLGLSLLSAAACVTLVMRPAWLPDNGLKNGTTVARHSPGKAVPQPSGNPHGAAPAGAPAAPGAESHLTASAAPAATPITIRPAMPVMLFQGTPLSQGDLPPNLDRSTKPVLEAQVPAGTVLLSKGCPVTSNDPDPIGDLSLITDGDKNGDDGYYTELMPGKVWVTIDLGQAADIHLLWVWHFHKQGVIYNDVAVQISDDPAFKSFTTVFNNDYDNSLGFGAGADQTYVETNNGRAIPVKGVRGRYVRLHSNGRTLDDTNQYIEVEVYGRPADGPPVTSLLADAGTAAPRPQSQLESEAKAEPQAEKPHLKDLAAAAAAPPPVSGPAPALATAIRPAMPGALFQGAPLPLTRGANQLAGNRQLSDGLRSVSAVTPTNVAYESNAAFRQQTTYQESLIHPETRRDAYHVSEQLSTESYQRLPVNPFQEVMQAPLSTFSIDVDTASYANMRRFLNAGSRPPAEAVRLEELVNYFPYDEAGPVDGKPFAVRVNVVPAPWDARHKVARILLKGKDIAASERPAGNLVFLVDVSGSMNEPNKLPLVQQSLRLLTERLTENDRVSLVTYAGNSQLVLPSTNGQNKQRILAAIDSLSSGGGTNGAGGIAMAYQQATASFIKDGANRVILATDGDFNIGASTHEELLKLITEKAKTGVFLSVLGYGMGNLKDDTMELLADKGNGNYAYIDSLSEARKALVEQMSGTLVTIAKDVKIQVEFNPNVVRAYKLLGYENRMLAKEDFNDDKKDAGEIGAGHTVTALYEIVPTGQPDVPVNAVVDGLKYQQQQTPAVITPKPQLTPAADSGEMMTVKLRWKQPQGETSELMEVPVKDSGAALDQASGETRWAVAVASFARLLREGGAGVEGQSQNQAQGQPALSWESVRQLARSAKGPDPLGYRGEFLQLIDKAESLAK
ncbi:MAG: DUF3520 domain-containing protein [Verrucomicrobiaceae bacterium]|nr:MAG: DUF3520 domain-containing protein [Verrucomicrobiaceae bacterium]